MIGTKTVDHVVVVGSEECDSLAEQLYHSPKS
jgi:hypothetical protein